MKMVKSLLLVSAAGLVAVSGAQAADLPKKAKAVEYVKVCSLYGAGFYYIAGSDICMKIGGYIRFQEGFGSTSNITSGPLTNNNFNNRITSTDTSTRNRAIASFDTRAQTAYGTLRTYLIMGYTQDSMDSPAPSNPTTVANGSSVYMTRGFIQIAGFTFGKATSYFDFVSSAAAAYNAGHLYTPDTGDGGQVLAAYTAQIGNGVSVSIAAEQDRKRGIDYLGTAAAGGGQFAQLSGAASAVAAGFAGPATATNIGGQHHLSTYVANVRIDQAWGSALVAVGIRNAGTSYFPNGQAFATTAGPTTDNGSAGNKWGYALTGGLRLNMPMIGAGDYFQGGVVYAKGASKYASNTPNSAYVASGNTVSFISHNDGGYTGTNAVGGIFELTTVWSAFASYEHFWTPSLRTSVYGSLINTSRSDALNNAMCASQLYGGATTVATRALGCDLNASAFNVGSRTQWNITKDLYVGLDVIYHRLTSAVFNPNNTATFTGTLNGMVNGVHNTGDHTAVHGTWRIHRDIVP